MADDDKRKPPPPDAEPPPRRPFSLADAVGRAAGDALKGASPVPRTDQVLAELRALLEARLDDPEGSLRRTLLARLADDLPLLDAHRDRPAGALAVLLDRTLAGEASLAGLVRETDARWGRDYGERPRFERGDDPPAPDDPYTVAGVRAALVRLRRDLET